MNLKHWQKLTPYQQRALLTNSYTRSPCEIVRRKIVRLSMVANPAAEGPAIVPAEIEGIGCQCYALFAIGPKEDNPCEC